MLRSLWYAMWTVYAPKAPVLNNNCWANGTTTAAPETETGIGHYSTGATVTLWNTGGMAPGGTHGKDSFGRKVYYARIEQLLRVVDAFALD